MLVCVVFVMVLMWWLIVSLCVDVAVGVVIMCVLLDMTVMHVSW